MRITYRTLRALSVIGEHPGMSNRAVADRAGVADQGQMSKLLARLERLGLVRNAAEGYPTGVPNEWCLTSRGEEVERATRARSGQAPDGLDGVGGARA